MCDAAGGGRHDTGLVGSLPPPIPPPPHTLQCTPYRKGVAGGYITQVANVDVDVAPAAARFKPTTGQPIELAQLHAVDQTWTDIGDELHRVGLR